MVIMVAVDMVSSECSIAMMLCLCIACRGTCTRLATHRLMTSEPKRHLKAYVRHTHTHHDKMRVMMMLMMMKSMSIFMSIIMMMRDIHINRLQNIIVMNMMIMTRQS